MITLTIMLFSFTIIGWTLRFLFRNDPQYRFQFDSWIGGIDPLTPWLYSATFLSGLVLLYLIIKYFP